MPSEHIFRNRTKTFFDEAELYTKGIVQSQLRNLELIREDLNANYHQAQHFITESNWDERAIVDQVRRENTASKNPNKYQALTSSRHANG